MTFLLIDKRLVLPLIRLYTIGLWTGLFDRVHVCSFFSHVFMLVDRL